MLADVRLESDEPVMETYCIEVCLKRIDACQTGALDGTTVDQKKCQEHAIYPNARSYDIAWCHTCRSTCPNAFGARKKR